MGIGLFVPLRGCKQKTGATPVFFQESADVVENAGVALRSSAQERSKSVLMIEQKGDAFCSFARESVRARTVSGKTRAERAAGVDGGAMAGDHDEC